MPDCGMLAHDTPLFVVQRPGLQQDGIGNADFSDVVQQRAPIDLPDLRRIAGKPAGKDERVAGDALRMMRRLALARIEGFDQGFSELFLQESVPRLHGVLRRQGLAQRSGALLKP